MHKFVVNLPTSLGRHVKIASNGWQNASRCDEMFDYERVEFVDVFTIQVSGQIVK